MVEADPPTPDLASTLFPPFAAQPIAAQPLAAQPLAAPDRALPPQCSSKGCRAGAVWQLRWNNPKLHTPEYRKTWLACADHRSTLGDFLQARRFLREVTPFTGAEMRSSLRLHL